MALTPQLWLSHSLKSTIQRLHEKHALPTPVHLKMGIALKASKTNQKHGSHADSWSREAACRCLAASPEMCPTCATEQTASEVETSRIPPASSTTFKGSQASHLTATGYSTMLEPRTPKTGSDMARIRISGMTKKARATAYRQTVYKRLSLVVFGTHSSFHVRKARSDCIHSR